jgi:hypothetical protein
MRHLLAKIFGHHRHCHCLALFAVVLLSASVAAACPVAVGSAVIATPSFGYAAPAFAPGYQSFPAVAAAVPCPCTAVQTQAQPAVVESQAQQAYAQPLVQSYAQAYVQPLAIAVPFVTYSAFATPFYGYNAANVFSRSDRFFNRGVRMRRSAVAVTTTRTRTVVRSR